MLLFILGYVSWLDISNLDPLAMPTSPVYFLTHLAEASLFAAITIMLITIIMASGLVMILNTFAED